jgi:hypothetical protein
LGEIEMLIRRILVAASFLLLVWSAPSLAQTSGGAVKEMLGKASDSALDRLSKPGAFSSDAAIRIALPGAGKEIDGLMNLASKAGLTGNIDESLNRAAEMAATKAKPIFRAAIDKASFEDGVAIARGGDTGATDYLKKNTSDEVKAQLAPLIKSALDDTGVLKHTSELQAMGMDEAKLTTYVTGKTSDGIFTYVGQEEAKARKNPIGTAEKMLKNLKY